MDALVTGAGGFLGRYIVERLLSRGDRVRALGRKPYPELQARGVEFVHADLCDRDSVVDACRAVDVVYHVRALPAWAGDGRIFIESTRLARAGLSKAAAGTGWADWSTPAARA